MFSNNRMGLIFAVVRVFAVTGSVAASVSCDSSNSADLVIAGARVFGADSSDWTISVSGDRICTVGRGSSHPAAEKTIDASGLIVLPGLIDSHVHLFPMGSSTGIDSDAALEQFIRDELPGRLREYLERGVTTVFSVGDAWPAVRDLRRRLEAGEISGPRLLIYLAKPARRGITFRENAIKSQPLARWPAQKNNVQDEERDQ